MAQQCFKVCHQPGGSFIYWTHVSFLTRKANAQSNNTPLAWIDIVYTNGMKKVLNSDSGVKNTCGHWHLTDPTEIKERNWINTDLFSLFLESNFVQHAKSVAIAAVFPNCSIQNFKTSLLSKMSNLRLLNVRHLGLAHQRSRNVKRFWKTNRKMAALTSQMINLLRRGKNWIASCFPFKDAKHFEMNDSIINSV